MMQENLIDFLLGMTALAHFGIALFFLRFWKESQDKLFAYFSSAFLLMASNQTIVSLIGKNGDQTAYSYWIRLCAFLLIIVGIITKNFGKQQNNSSFSDDEKI